MKERAKRGMLRKRKRKDKWARRGVTGGVFKEGTEGRGLQVQGKERGEKRGLRENASVYKVREERIQGGGPKAE